jgi:hypothetical protein
MGAASDIRYNGDGKCWAIQENCNFSSFIEYYRRLWTPSNQDFLVDTIGCQRHADAIRISQSITAEEWSMIARKASGFRRTILCTDAFSGMRSIIRGDARLLKLYETFSRRPATTKKVKEWDGPRQVIRTRAESGVYLSKFVSQLFYDIAIPYDTSSYGKQREMHKMGIHHDNRCNYTGRGPGGKILLQIASVEVKPEKFGSDLVSSLYCHMTNNKVSIFSIAEYDNARECYWDEHVKRNIIRTAITRPIDKCFY